MDGKHAYRVRFKESFHIREEALKSIEHSVHWQLSPDGNSIFLEQPIENYRPHEVALLRFLMDQETLAENIFAELDRQACENLSICLLRIYGPQRLVSLLFN